MNGVKDFLAKLMTKAMKAFTHFEFEEVLKAEIEQCNNIVLV